VVYHTDQDPKRGAKPRLDREALADISMRHFDITTVTPPER
jgi:hypothetical protein